MAFRYLPMLRSKAGEAIALSNLTGAAKGRLYPVVHLVHEPPPTFGDTVGSAWAKRPIALDGTFQTFTAGSHSGFMHVLAQLGKGGALVVPCIEYGATGGYLAAVQKAVGTYGVGLMIKVKPNRLSDVANWMDAQGWTSSQVDLVISLGEIAGYDPDLLAPMVAKAVADGIPNPGAWRSITLSSSAAPKDMGELSSGQNLVPRSEWKVWKDVAASAPYVNYSDYSTLTPDLTDPPGYVMARATVSVRYAIDDYWLVLKGRATTGKSGLPMTSQYSAHAKVLNGHKSFGGLTDCWGDDRIRQIAAGGVKAGGRPQWASYTASRHLSLVADRLP